MAFNSSRGLMETMTLTEAVAVLNEHKHRGRCVWCVVPHAAVATTENGNYLEPLVLTEFEAIAVAEKYLREGAVKPSLAIPVRADEALGPNEWRLEPAPPMPSDSEMIGMLSGFYVGAKEIPKADIDRFRRLREEAIGHFNR